MTIVVRRFNVQAAVAGMKQGAFVLERPVDDRLLSALEAAFAYCEGRFELLEAKRRLATLRTARQVLDGQTVGQASKMIADQLGISVRTVEVHRARLLHRLGVQKIAAAVRIAVIGEFAEGGALGRETRLQATA